MKPITAIVADDLTMLREGIAWRLGSEPDLHIIGAVADGKEALRLVERHRPDVLIMEAHLPELDALAMLQEFQRRRIGTRVVILTSERARGHVLPLLESGASGYVLKNNDVDRLIETIRGVADGRVVVAPEVAQVVLDAHYGNESPQSKEPTKLTNRERQVLSRLAEGFSNSEIAADLFISIKTVETHRMNLYRKLGVRTVSELVLTAVKHELITV